MNPYVLAGALIGIAMPPVFSALTMLGVGKNAHRMIKEIRRQFKEIPGILEGKNKPDYVTCVDIAAKGAIKELIPPSLLTIITTLAVGFILGKQALGGYLAGTIFTGLAFALLMANSGGLLDNAKKIHRRRTLRQKRLRPTQKRSRRRHLRRSAQGHGRPEPQHNDHGHVPSGLDIRSTVRLVLALRPLFTLDSCIPSIFLRIIS